MKRIVAFAYSCEPDRGSEPGAGWAWAQLLARLGDVWVITRANNREVIEPALHGLPDRDRLHFVYVDLPRWARFWKRGHRGVRVYYLLWQLDALFRARRLHRQQPFDLAWHVTMANVWFGSTAALLRVPFVYGPVGGGGRLAWRLLPGLGIRGAAYELVRATILTTARACNPLARVACARAKLILVQNPETLDWLPPRHRAKAAVFPNAVMADGFPDRPDPAAAARRSDDAPVALFAGRLLPMKGCAFAIGAIAHLPHWRLLIFGEGPDRRRLDRLAARRGVADRVVFAGWVPRKELLGHLRASADVFVFPGLHEQASWAVGEALSAGLPVVCFEGGGSTVLTGGGVPTSWPRHTERSLAAGMAAAVGRHPAPPHLDPDSRFADLCTVLASTSVPVPGDADDHPR